MLSRVKVFYFFRSEAPTTHGYPRVYGGPDPASSDASFETQISHLSHEDLTRKLQALMPNAKLKDVWQVVRGGAVYLSETNYHAIARAAPLTVLFVV